MRLALIFLSLNVAACFDPTIADGSFTCGTTPPVCPPNMMCVGGVCTAHTLDLSGNVDAAGGSIFGNGMLGDVSNKLLGSGQLQFNTETGEIDLIPTVGAKSLVVTANPPAGFTQFSQTGGPGVAIWNFSNLVVPPSITVTPSPSNTRVVVIESTSGLTVLGGASFAAYGGRGGASTHGGFGPNPMTPGGAGGTDTVGSSGGAGGYTMAGGIGSCPPGAVSCTAPEGGPAYGTDDLTVVYFGAGGGGGAGANFKGGRGGNGGGALVLFGHNVELAGTFDLSGEAGQASQTDATTYGGGGGGAGGSLLVGGDSVRFDAASDGGVPATVSLGGGMGGHGSSGSLGGTGSPGRASVASLGITGLPPNVKMQPGISTFPR
jgi:hypothetical protein